MKNIEILSVEDIRRIMLKHYEQYNKKFIDFQSIYLSDLYKNFNSMEKGNIALFFSIETQRSILRKKDYDFFHSLSFIEFWKNHELINHKKYSIGKISLEINLPKETTRRNILELIKQKILEKKKGITCFLPNENYKNNFNKFIEAEIDILVKLIQFIFIKLDFPMSKEEIKIEIKKNFSFYWLHYLEAELKYLKEWKNDFDDLELLLISKQCSNTYLNKIQSDGEDVIINATEISESSGIPRATCLRKLDKLKTIKAINQNKNSKRYFMSSDNINNSPIDIKDKSFEIIKIYSDFFYICVMALSPRT